MSPVQIRLLKFADKFFGGLLSRAFPGVCSSDIVAISPRSVLLIRPGGIGDAMLLLPAIRAFREAYPQAAIDILAERRNGQVFSFLPNIRRIFLYDQGTVLLAVMRNRYDVVIDTEQWHRLSAVVARLTRAPMSLGYATNERKRLFTHPVTYSHDDYELESFFHLLSPLGIVKPEKVAIPFLQVPENAVQKVKELLADLEGKQFVVIFPGASITERRWHIEKFKAVAEAIWRVGIQVVAVGGREDTAAGEQIIANKHGLNLAGKTSLAETAAIIDRSAVLVSGDSGILHIGVALGKPTVSLFGPGIARKWAPRGENHIILNKNQPCSPCSRFGYTPKCPIDVRCLQQITVDEVVNAILALLKKLSKH